jgi:hypothetical protein
VNENLPENIGIYKPSRKGEKVDELYLTLLTRELYWG